MRTSAGSYPSLIFHPLIPERVRVEGQRSEMSPSDIQVLSLHASPLPQILSFLLKQNQKLYFLASADRSFRALLTLADVKPAVTNFHWIGSCPPAFLLAFSF